MYDVIIIGAGIGGLSCGAKLANSGKKVLILEKIDHVGGTSHIFYRKGFTFPMGPLSFSFPDLVVKLLRDMGVDQIITFRQCHYQLLTPEINVVYSLKWESFKQELKDRFPEDSEGLETVFTELTKIINAIKDIHEWHPEFLVGKEKEHAIAQIEKHHEKLQIIEKYDKISSEEFLNAHLRNNILIRLLGSQGTYEPIMSMVHLAFMWNVMSHQGIWFPNCGIHGIDDMLAGVIEKNQGKILLNTPVKEILVKNGQAYGISTIENEDYFADWIVSNADYKKTFLELLDKRHVTKEHLSMVKSTPYTGSEISVFLGIDPKLVRLDAFNATHLFYRAQVQDVGEEDPLNFENKEIEICRWSQKSDDFTPNGLESLIIRTNFPYNHFADWRTGYKKRKEGYYKYKKEVADKLIHTVEKILPGLTSAIKIREVATPLTYQDWGQRYRGSIAGWSRDIRQIRLNTKVLTASPIERLLMIGIYSVIEPFLGGYPVSLYTGKMAADLILEKEKLASD